MGLTVAEPPPVLNPIDLWTTECQTPLMSQPLSRRDLGRFLGPALLATTGACAPQASTRTWVASVSSLEGGQSIRFEYPSGHDAFVVRLEVSAEGGAGEDAAIVAFHQACPHMGCPLSPTAESATTGELGPCGCHQSRFDMRSSGRQIEGRATQGLVRVILEVEDGEIYALGIEGTPFGEAPNA